MVMLTCKLSMGQPCQTIILESHTMIDRHPPWLRLKLAIIVFMTLRWNQQWGKDMQVAWDLFQIGPIIHSKLQISRGKCWAQWEKEIKEMLALKRFGERLLKNIPQRNLWNSMKSVSDFSKESKSSNRFMTKLTTMKHRKQKAQQSKWIKHSGKTRKRRLSSFQWSTRSQSSHLTLSWSLRRILLRKSRRPNVSSSKTLRSKTPTITTSSWVWASIFRRSLTSN